MYASETVANGQVTIDDYVEKAVIGLPYRYTLKPMRFDAQFRDGTTRGSIKKISEMVMSFYKSGMVEYGPDTDDLRNIDWRTTESYGTPPELYTGDQTVVFEGGFDAEDSILITGNSPLPCTLRAMVLRADVTGR